MLSRIINSVTQKEFIPLWFILVVLVFIDISTRLTEFKTKKNTHWALAEATENAGLILNKEQADSIISAIDNYQITPEKEAGNINNTMSAAEQQAQQGSLSELFSGTIRYRLVGIFDKNERFSVIQQYDISTNEQKLIKLSVLEHLKNYQITKILANKVTLTSTDNRQISLYLYTQAQASKHKQLKAIKSN
ncbi:MAG: hypothetical protein JJV99_03520 [Colwellia sp.]|nr:hypothetical protein [Colwellia sp.]